MVCVCYPVLYQYTKNTNVFSQVSTQSFSNNSAPPCRCTCGVSMKTKWTCHKVKFHEKSARNDVAFFVRIFCCDCDKRCRLTTWCSWPKNAWLVTYKSHHLKNHSNGKPCETYKVKIFIFLTTAFDLLPLWLWGTGVHAFAKGWFYPIRKCHRNKMTINMSYYRKVWNESFKDGCWLGKGQPIGDPTWGIIFPY